LPASNVFVGGEVEEGWNNLCWRAGEVGCVVGAIKDVVAEEGSQEVGVGQELICQRRVVELLEGIVARS
jgi:hypothetical protein